MLNILVVGIRAQKERSVYGKKYLITLQMLMMRILLSIFM